MGRRSKAVLVAIVFLLPLTGCGGRLPWRSDWERALAEAQRDVQPSVLMFAAAFCPRCMKMDRDVFTDPRVREELVTYKLVRIDFVTHAKLAEQYGFTGTPSFLMFSATGRVIGKYAGVMDAQEFLRFLLQSSMNR